MFRDPICALKNAILCIGLVEALMTLPLLLGVGGTCTFFDDAAIEYCSLLGTVDPNIPRYLVQGYNGLHAVMCLGALAVIGIYYKASARRTREMLNFLSPGRQRPYRRVMTDLLFILLCTVGMCGGVVWIYGVGQEMWYFSGGYMVYIPLNSLLATYLCKLDLRQGRIRRLFIYRTRRDQELGFKSYAYQGIRDSDDSSESEDEERQASVSLQDPLVAPVMIGGTQLCSYVPLLRDILKGACYLMALHNLVYLLYDALEMAVRQLDPAITHNDAKIDRVFTMVILYYRLCVTRAVYETC